MAQHKHKKQSSRPHPKDIGHMVADVPVIISISHGNDLLKKYAEMIDVDFDMNTPEGRENMGKFHYLKQEQKLSTESALFTLASEAVRYHAQQLLSMFASMMKLGSAVQHELHLHIKRDGVIKYRAEMK